MKLFTVGPVEMYKDTLLLGKEPIPYFRNQLFSNIIFELDNNIKSVLCMKENDKNIILTASGTGAMEAVVLNCLTKGDKALVISGGSFGERFVELCILHGIPHDILRIPFGDTLSTAMLKPFENKGYSAMLVNIHETSTGQLYPISLLSEFCTRNKMLFLVDAISSLFADPIDFSKDKIDALIFSSQKALALPPGVAVVSLSERMCNKVQKQKIPSMYFDFVSYLKDGERGQTPFTPAIGIILQMNEMIKKIKEEGINKKVERTKKLADDFRKKAREQNFPIPDYPLSNALTPVLFNNDAEYYYNELVEKYRLVVNPCGGSLKQIMLRVGHMGNLQMEDNNLLIEALCNIRENKG